MTRTQWLPFLIFFASVWHRATTSTSPGLEIQPVDRILQNNNNNNWDAFNNLIYPAVLHFPDSEMTSVGMTLRVTNLQCTNVRINDITLQSTQPSNRQVVATTTLTGLDLTCTAQYEFDGYLFVSGGGNLLLESFQNEAIIETVVASVDYRLYPPHNSSIRSCQPTININRLDFSNGGFWDFTLEAVETLFRSWFEDAAESRLCEELEQKTYEQLNAWLKEMQGRLDQYPPDIVIDPLASETALITNQVGKQVTPSVASPLLNWLAPETYPFGFFLEEAWKDMVKLLNQQVVLSSGTTSLQANLLLQENVLTNGLLVTDITDPDDQLLYKVHDQWTRTIVKAKQVRIKGLDSLTKLDPMVTIGQYTLQSKLSWKSLVLELDLSLEIQPSTRSDSYITGGQAALAGIQEDVTVTFAMSRVDAVISLLLALDQADVEALQVGHLLQKDNILPCFLSSIYQTELSGLSVEAMDLQPPKLSGFVSGGLDKLISNTMDLGFLLYESSMLQSSKAFFQTAIREVINESIQEKHESFGVAECQLLRLPAPHGIVDVRELLLDPTMSVLSGGAGKERYGDLFYGFVMPTLQKQVLTDDNINQNFLRPYTLDQSGKAGVLDVSHGEPLFRLMQEDPNATTWVGLLGYDRFEVQAYDAKIFNVDTITTPVDILNPKDDKVLSNVIQTGNNSTNRPLKLTIRLAVSGRGRMEQVPDMLNEVELSLKFPTTLIAADFLVAMNETSLLNFPLKDVDNEYCWLAALTPRANRRALDLVNIVMSTSSFTLDLVCLSCSSPGGVALPDVVGTMKAAGLTTSFEPFLEVLLAEATQGAWTNMKFDAMIKDAPKLCPHHADYDADAIASDEYGVANGMAAPPQWSKQSAETIAAIGFLSAYTSLFVVSLNHLLQPELQLPSQQQDVEVLAMEANQTLEMPRLLDWTNLSASLGSWADGVFIEAREAFRIPTTNEPDASRRLLSRLSSQMRKGNARMLHADSFLQDHILDEDGTTSVEFDDLQASFAGIVFAVKQARLFGLDSITNLDPFIPLGPQSLQNKVKLQKLQVSLDLEVIMDREASNMTIDFSFSDVTAEVPLLLAIDLDKIGTIELGSLLQVSKILPCLLEGAHKVHIPQLDLTIGTMERPTIYGSLSPELMSAVMAISDSLFDSYGNELSIALPGLFDTFIRRTLNNWLDQIVRQVDPDFCSISAGGGAVDFRDLFLSPEKSEVLGGTGKQQYGDLFVTLHEMLRDELETKDGTPPSINDLLTSWTAEQSNSSGTLHLLGNLLNTSASITLAGLDAILGIQLGDISLENVDSLGPPLSLLDPLDAHTLNNTASFGIGPDPLKVTARMMLSLTDNDEMHIRNDVNVSISIYEATAAATLFLRIAEDALLKFPLKDVTNSYCWLSTIFASTDDLQGIALVGHALRLQEMHLNVSCFSCTSPQFGELIADLYNPVDGEEATETVLQTLSRVLNGDAIQDYLDQIVLESSSKCPHSSDYDPGAILTAIERLKNQGPSFGFTDFTARSKRSSYFNIASGIFAACLFSFFVIGKAVVWRQNRKWKESLSSEGMLLLRRQKAKEREEEEIINIYSTSLLQSPHIARKVRFAVPAVILLNVALYLGGHTGVISTVDVEVYLAGENFTIHNFLVFSFLDSTAKTYKNGGMEMSIMLWIFTGVWPYVKLLSSLYLWVVPPRMLSVSTRGKLLLWIDTLTKLSIIDIFTLILFLAVFLVYIGGPDKALNADGTLYSMKAIVIPGASLYCMVIAQRISRVSSRFFLEYHDQDVAAARKACSKGELVTEKKGSHSGDPPNCDNRETMTASDGPHGMSRIEEHQIELNDEKSENYELEGSDKITDCRSRNLMLNLQFSDLDSAREAEASSNSPSDDDTPRWCLLRSRLFSGHLGVVFGGLTVLVLAIIGCIYAPSVSVEISDLWGLAIEAETTFEEAATEYGVFLVVSSVLLKSRFVLDATWDFVALGFLLAVAFISVGMVFFIGCYTFLKRLMVEGWSAIRPNSGSMIELPAYLRLHAYKHIEVYVVAVVVGCWQLGSVTIYAIHLYCSILDAVYRVLTYIGLAQTSAAQCFEAQMTISDNVLIFFGALLILFGNFCVQCSKQYQRNVNEACEQLRQEDHGVDHLSSLWNTSSKKGFWKSSRQLMLKPTATCSEDDSAGDDTPNSYMTTKSSSPAAFFTDSQSPKGAPSSSTAGSSSPAGSENSDAKKEWGLSSGTLADGHRVVASVEQYSTPH